MFSQVLGKPCRRRLSNEDLRTRSATSRKTDSGIGSKRPKKGGRQRSESAGASFSSQPGRQGLRSRGWCCAASEADSQTASESDRQLLGLSPF